MSDEFLRTVSEKMDINIADRRQSENSWKITFELSNLTPGSRSTETERLKYRAIWNSLT